jgi:hypothetical protein
MISGYMPLEYCGKFFPDEMVDRMDHVDDECEAIIKLSSGNVKAGDSFSFGDIEATNVEISRSSHRWSQVLHTKRMVRFMRYSKTI